MGLVSARPLPELASTGYCLANPEREFVVYLPEGDSATVDLTRMKGTLRAEWMQPVEGTVVPGGTVAGGKSTRLDVPFVGPAALYLLRE
jgi:Putative collagen-binding domain of a collagenase